MRWCLVELSMSYSNPTEIHGRISDLAAAQGIKSPPHALDGEMIDNTADPD